MSVKVAVYGATGYTGLELLRAIRSHPEIEITALVSGSSAGKRFGEVVPFAYAYGIGEFELVEEPGDDYDLAFLCLPHEVSLELVPELLDKGKKVIDLSGAYRIKEASAYPDYYGFEHSYPQVLNRAVYGLPEMFRDKIKGASLVANPGCYPTATLLALYPLLKEEFELEEVVVHALSGISGAGRKPKQEFHFPDMTEGFFSYSVEKHRHTPEMEGSIKLFSGKDIKVRFTPTVIPISRGMLSTVYLKLHLPEARLLYTKTYEKEPFVKVIDRPPNPKWVRGTNLCLVYPFYDERTGCLTVQSAIDNLGKGASLQAVQNMNLMLGFGESLGLDYQPVFP